VDPRARTEADAHLAASSLAGGRSFSQGAGAPDESRAQPTTDCFRDAWRPDVEAPVLSATTGRMIFRAMAGGILERQVDGDDDGGSGGATTMPYASCHLQCSAAGSARASRDRPYSLAIGGAVPAERCTTRGRAAHRVPFTTTVAASTVASVVASVLSASRSSKRTAKPSLSRAQGR